MTDYLEHFVFESNMIEGIFDSEEIQSSLKRTETILALDALTVGDLMEFNTAGALRNHPEMNIMMGHYRPPKGGPSVVYALNSIVDNANNGNNPYFVHMDFETLHPFMDGNGRTGRVIWLWQMVEQKGYDISRGFLHQWYYQSLQYTNRSEV